MDNNLEQLKKILKKAHSLEVGKEITLAKEFISIDDKIDKVGEDLNTKISDLSDSLKKKLDEELVYEVDEEKIVNSVLSKVEIPDPIKGDKGDDYILTAKDKKDIAKSIKVPIAEKVIERIETIVEQPIVTNEIKEVAIPVLGEEIVDKINELPLEDEFKIDASHIKNLPETKGGKWYGGSGIKEIIAGAGISVDNSRLGYPEISAPGSTTDEKVKYNVSDASAGYLADKVVAGTGITLSEGTGGDADKLKITNTLDLTNYFDKTVDDTDDITDTASNRFTDDTAIARLANTSGTNTGDNATNSQYSGLEASKVPYTGATTNVDLGTNTLTTPTIIGGTGVTDTLTLKPTSGVGTTGADIIFKVGNNGATEAMRIANTGTTKISDYNAYGSSTNSFQVFQNNTNYPGQYDGVVFKIRSDASIKIADKYSDTIANVGLHINYQSKALPLFIGRDYSNAPSSGGQYPAILASTNSTGTFDFTGNVFASIVTGALTQNANSGASFSGVSQYDSNNYANPANIYGAYLIAKNTSTVATNGAGAKNWYGGYFKAIPTFATSNTNSTAIGIYATATGAEKNYAGIFEAGNVGIGLTAPLYPLHIRGAGATKATTALYVDNSTPAQIFKLLNDGGMAVGLGTTLTGANSFVLGQYSQTTGDIAVAIGYNQRATATGAICISANAGSGYSEASGPWSVIVGGLLQKAQGRYSTIIGGIYGSTTMYNQITFGHDRLVAGTGSFQTSIVPLSASITGTAQTELFIPSLASGQAIIPVTSIETNPAYTMWNVTVTVNAFTASVGNGTGTVNHCFGGEYRCIVRRAFGSTTVTMVGSGVQTIYEDADTTMADAVVTIDGDSTTGALRVRFTPPTTAGSTTNTRVGCSVNYLQTFRE